MTSPAQAPKETQFAQLQRIGDHLRQGLPLAAKALAARFTVANPENAEGWVLLSRSCGKLSEFEGALDAAQHALAIEHHDTTARLMLIEALLGVGRYGDAIAAARELEAEVTDDAAAILQVGYSYTRTNRHSDAARCYEKVRALEPANHGVLHNLAGAYLALGKIESAEPLYEELLRTEKHAYEAYYNRATLRRQTPERNHIAEMENALSAVEVNTRAEAVLCYSLAKELEDIEAWERSFAYLRRGAAILKRLSAYRVEPDLAMMDELARQFDEAFFAQRNPGHRGKSPIFVLGMPRSGTTLVDRILSSHSAVGSVGESDEFHRTLLRLVHGAGERLDSRRVRTLDWERVGRDYCCAVDEILPGRERLLDKTPRNFLYLGLIVAALPGARIIHLRRQPMDACYAVYKTLFRQGYPYACDLTDLGRYYVAYSRLLDHWRRILPDRFLDVDYEDLVGHQEETTRRMLAFCGLEWEDGCLSFDENEAPLLTASSAQVRQPIYKTSVALWRRYERELAPLARVLRQGGIACD
jgi:tetratricopeptide (TPR) repeat protein